ncbi:MAG: TolC family protein [Curvibacter sp.]|nr:TolC family protein [Curvibacter sp.]
MKRLFPMMEMLLIAGCTSYTPRPLDASQQQSALEARRLDAPAVRLFAERSLGHDLTLWPPHSWDFDALTLAAFTFHPDLDRDQAQRLVAETAVVTAGARPNPSLGTSFQRSQNPPTGTSPWTNGINLDIPLETAGKRDYRIAQSLHLADAARLRSAEAVWQVRSRVRVSLLASYPTESRVQRQHDLQAEIATILERRFALGSASQPEVTQAHLFLNQATLALRDNQKQQAENLARLAAAVGIPASALDGAEIAYASFESLLPLSALPAADTRRQALLARPDVLAALADYEAAQSALQLEIARQYPDVSLGPGYTYDQGLRRWSLGLSLALPIMNRNEGPIAEARARREVAAAAFLTVQAKAIAEVDEALTSYAHALQSFESADLLLQNQRRKERSAESALRVGEADRLGWLSAQYETVAADLARITTLTQAQLSLGRLEDALRRPLGAQALALTAEQVISAKHQRNGSQP